MQNIVELHKFKALEQMPPAELEARWSKVRGHLARLAPTSSGLLVFSRLNIYYLSGTLGNGLLWLPMDGRPVLLLRKGMGRAGLESPLDLVAPFKSFREAPDLLAGFGQPLGREIAVEMSGLTWAMAEMFKSRIQGVTFNPGDKALILARAVKSEWELKKLRQAGQRHQVALEETITGLIAPGMTENEIFRIVADTYLGLGHGGQIRMNAPGEEVFFGHVAAADSGNYPHYYNGPMGFRGIHPAQHCLGSDTVWAKKTILAIDNGFSFQGYVTDKTQVYWAGPENSLPDQARHAYAICVEAQDRAAEDLRPGVCPAEIWLKIKKFVSNTPFSQGFMGLGENQAPFLGHSIGLAVDEQPVIAQGFDQPFAAGTVIALEPKIGLPGFGMVGIESTYEITENGAVCLTSKNSGMIFWP